MQVSKISKAEIAPKNVHFMKHFHEMNNCKQGHGLVGSLSIVDPKSGIRMELHRLRLEWKSRKLKALHES